MQFVSYAELAQDVRIWAETLGHYDVVLGVPRSGMIPAAMLALAWNCSLSTPALYPNLLSGGQRDVGPRGERIIIIEDSWNTGRSMKAAQAMFPDADAGVVYATKDCPIPHARVVQLPRIFEWNVFHHFWLQQTCMDIDGVLCVDPTKEENDDGPKYQHFLRTAKAKWLPTRTVAHLVTSRLEKYRRETELWLNAQGVKYGQLHMLDCKDARERRRLNLHARHKGKVATDVGAKLFVESSYRQASAIFQMTGIPTLCTDCMVMFS